LTFVPKTTILFSIQYAGLLPTENTHSNLIRMFQKQLKSYLLLAAALLFWGSAAIAQRQISGRVTDAETGDPLIGASVIVTGTTVGSIADVQGNFRLALPADA
jgi:iron complex outermembrane receptor protein